MVTPILMASSSVFSAAARRPLRGAGGVAGFVLAVGARRARRVVRLRLAVRPRRPLLRAVARGPLRRAGGGGVGFCLEPPVLAGRALPGHQRAASVHWFARRALPAAARAAGGRADVQGGTVRVVVVARGGAAKRGFPRPARPHGAPKRPALTQRVAPVGVALTVVVASSSRHAWTATPRGHVVLFSEQFGLSPTKSGPLALTSEHVLHWWPLVVPEHETSRSGTFQWRSRCRSRWNMPRCLCPSTVPPQLCLHDSHVAHGVDEVALVLA